MKLTESQLGNLQALASSSALELHRETMTGAVEEIRDLRARLAKLTRASAPIVAGLSGVLAGGGMNVNVAAASRFIAAVMEELETDS